MAHFLRVCPRMSPSVSSHKAAAAKNSFRFGHLIFGKCYMKLCLQGWCGDQVGFKPSCSVIETYLACSRFSFTFQRGNNKDADQTVWLCRLVCALVVHKPWRQVFLHWGPYINSFLASGNFCSMLITFASFLIWIQVIWHSDVFPYEFLKKNDFEKNQQTTINPFSKS